MNKPTIPRTVPQHASSMPDGAWTLTITMTEVESWQAPPMQRPVVMNDRVLALAASLERDPTISSTITLGRIAGDSKTLWVVDGQHRLAAAKLSNITSVTLTVDIKTFANMAELAKGFVALNTPLRALKSDDMLRGLEYAIPALQFIRAHCPFVGYANIRHGRTRLILSMSVCLRAWHGSRGNTPNANNGRSSSEMAHSIDVNEAKVLTDFLILALAAWGSDPEYSRLWGKLNLGMSMWLYRKLVVDTDRSGGGQIRRA